MERKTDITLRNERETDFRAVEELTREAFWNVYVPGCCEHYLAHEMRAAPQFLPELDFVAERDGRLLGSILYARTRIVDAAGREHPVITFGPLSVLPEYQGQGIGSLLVEHSKKRARELGFPAIVICGDPRYYGRFGFEPAEKYGIRDGIGLFAPALQICWLDPEARRQLPGRFEDGPAYQIDERKAEEFDRSFPQKEKGSSPTQARFQELVSLAHE